MRRKVLERLSKNGTLVEPDAADYLCKQPNALEFIENYVTSEKRNLPMILSLKELQQIFNRDQLNAISDINIVTDTTVSPVSLKEIKIKKDITGKSTSIGDIADFMRLFQDRYRTMKKLLLRRQELQGSIAISKAKRIDRDVKIIGMVSSVRLSKKGHKIIELEDEDDSAVMLVLRDSSVFNELVVNDEVIGVIGTPAKRGEMIVVKEIIRPDIPINGSMTENDSNSWALFAGDIHVGSDKFLKNQWEAFIEWLKRADDARDVRYLVLPGDLVDGIGIYPDQEDELLINNVYEQYEMLAEYLKEVRDDISIIAAPGNHDAVRLAEPQPALSRSICKSLDSNITMVGNPVLFDLEGRSILVYHGRSFDDWIGAAPGLSYEKPLEIMREMLRRRHLAPIYGERTAIAPEQKDHLVIDEVPDIFVTGHIHNAGLGDYRGVTMINASTWQDQTSYQKMHNHRPDPCKVFMIHLGTGKARVVKFT